MPALLPLPDAPHAPPTRQTTAEWAAHVARWCRTLCDGRTNPDDVAQDVLIVLLQDAPPTEDDDHLRGWLWGVTWRTVRGHQRRAWVRRWLAGPSEHWIDRVPAAVGVTDTDRAVKTVLETLRPEHQKLLWLAYAEGASRAEICAAWGLTTGTLNRKLTAARAAFDTAARRAGLEAGNV
jgi:DNA-directed RNA polymerase specialized sigma24 family protein